MTICHHNSEIVSCSKVFQLENCTIIGYVEATRNILDNKALEMSELNKTWKFKLNAYKLLNICEFLTRPPENISSIPLCWWSIVKYGELIKCIFKINTMQQQI